MKENEKQEIKELTNELVFTSNYGTHDAVAKYLYEKGWRKQKHGKWEKRVCIIFDMEKVGYNCSECNTTWDNETKCCPNCGAYMEGANDGRAD